MVCLGYNCKFYDESLIGRNRGTSIELSHPTVHVKDGNVTSFLAMELTLLELVDSRVDKDRVDRFV